MKFATKILLAVLVLVMVGSSAMAADYKWPHVGYTYPGYVDAPDWSGNSYYTHQSWDFMAVDDGVGNPTEPTISFAPDAGDHAAPWVNSYGTPLMTGTGPRIGYTGENIAHAWEWTDWGMGMEHDDCYGHYGGMGSGYVTFEIPNCENTDLKKEIWVQYIVYLPIGGSGPEGASLTGFFLDEPTFNPATGDPANTFVGTRLSKEWEQIDGPGYSGKWWRVTEEWEIDPQPGKEYFWLATNVDGGPATLIDTVDIDTQCVPEPATMAILGLGSLFALVRRRK